MSDDLEQVEREHRLLDPHTGEVFASLVERDELVERLAGELVLGQALAARRSETEAHLLALQHGQPRPVSASVVVPMLGVRAAGVATVEPGRKGSRSVMTAEVVRHAEALEPIGLAPVPQPPVTPADKMPTVSQFTTRAARQKLARVGLTPEQFLTDPAPPGAPRVAVYLED